MKLSKRKMVILIYSVVNLFLILGILLAPAFATDYPTKPITLIIGMAPGGANDLAARTVAGYFTKKWGQQVVVVSKPGGNLVPANVEVYNSKPDGYTLLADTNAASSFQAATIKNLPYKVEDRTFVVNAFATPSAYLCNSKKPWKTLKDVADYVKREPSNFKWSSLGITASSTLGVLLFLDVIGADRSKTKMVDYPSGVEQAVSLGSGETDFMFMGLAASKPYIDAGKIRALAFVSPQRVKTMPTIPTVQELGLPQLDSVSLWNGISGPPGLPKEIVEKWNQGMKEASTDVEFTSLVEKLGNIMNYLPPDEYKKMVLEQAKNLREVLQKIGAR